MNISNIANNEFENQFWKLVKEINDPFQEIERKENIKKICSLKMDMISSLTHLNNIYSQILICTNTALQTERYRDIFALRKILKKYNAQQQDVSFGELSNILSECLQQKKNIISVLYKLENPAIMKYRYHC